MKFIILIFFSINSYANNLHDFVASTELLVEKKGVQSQAALIENKLAAEISGLNSLKQPTAEYYQNLLDLLYMASRSTALSNTANWQEMKRSWQAFISSAHQNNIKISLLDPDRIQTVRYIVNDKDGLKSERITAKMYALLTSVPTEVINISPAQKIFLCDMLYYWGSNNEYQQCSSYVINSNVPFSSRWTKKVKSLFSNMKLHLLDNSQDNIALLPYILNKKHFQDIDFGQTEALLHLLSAIAERNAGKFEQSIDRLIKVLKLPQKKISKFKDNLQLELAYNQILLKQFKQAKQSILLIDIKDKYSYLKGQRALITIAAAEKSWSAARIILDKVERYPISSNHNSSLLADFADCLLQAITEQKAKCEKVGLSYVNRVKMTIATNDEPLAIAKLMEIISKEKPSISEIENLKNARSKFESVGKKYIALLIDGYLDKKK